MRNLGHEEWSERFPRHLRRRLWLGLTGVTLVALAVRLPLLGTTYTASDTAYYVEQAKELFHQGYTSNLRPPAYPTLLALLELTGANPASAAVVLQNLIGLFMPGFVLLVGWRFFSPGVGFVAGFLAAASPLTFAIEQFALTDYFFSVVLFAAVAVLAEAMLRLRPERLPWGWFIASGTLFGLATLLRANGLYAVLAVPVALVLAGPRWKPSLRGAATVVGALIAVIAPWCVYNLVHFHDLTVANEGGLSLYSRAISYDGVRPPADSEAGRVALSVYNTANPNENEGTVSRTGPVYEALHSELGLSQIEATRKMGEIAREAIADDPGPYVRGTIDLLGRYQGAYYPRTLVGRTGRDQVSLATAYTERLDLDHQPVSHSGWIRVPWGLGQALTEILFILTAGGLLILTLPFFGERRSRVAAIAFLVLGLLGLLVVALTARFELRHGVVFAPFVWVLAPATVSGLVKLVASMARRPRLRTRHATS